MNGATFFGKAGRRKSSAFAPNFSFAKPCLVAGIVLTAPTLALGQTTDTWNGGSAAGTSTPDWSEGSNWVSGSPPNEGDNLIFSGGSITDPTNDLLTSVNSITFNAPGSGSATSFNVGGNQITLGPGTGTGNDIGLANNSGVAQTISLGASSASPGGITLSGGGTQEWNAASTAGALNVDTDVNLNGTTLSIVGPGTTTISGIITGQGSGAASIIIGDPTGAVGNLTLNGNNSYGASTAAGGVGTILYSGTLTLNNNNALGTGTLSIRGNTGGGFSTLASGTAGLIVNNSVDVESNFTVNPTGDLQLTGRVTLNNGGGTVTIINAGGSSSSLTFAGGITEATAGTNLTLSGGNTSGGTGGTFVFGGGTSNTYTGLTTVQDGATLKLNDSSASIMGDLTIDAASLVQALKENQFNGTDQTVTINGTGTFDLNGTSQTIGHLEDDGSGHGVVDLGSGAVLTITDTSNFSGNITDSGHTAGGAVTIGTVSSTVTVQLSGTNTYGGATTINTGNTLEADSFGSLSNSSDFTDNGTLNIHTAGTAETPNESNLGTFPNTYVIGALSGTGNVTNTSANDVIFAVGATNNAGTFSGTISETAGSGTITLVKTGTGTETLSGGNTYTGGTFIFEGTLQLGSGTTNVLKSGSDVFVNNASSGGVAEFNVNGATQTLGTLTLVNPASSGSTQVLLGGGTLTINTGITVHDVGSQTGTGTTIGSTSDTGNLVLGTGATITVNSNGAISNGTADLTINSKITSGAVDYTGTSSDAVLELTNANNSYAGGTTINSGILIAGTGNVFGTGAVTNGMGANPSLLAAPSVLNGSNAAETITISNNYTQGASGALQLDVVSNPAGTGASVAGTNYDTLHVAGSGGAVLNGGNLILDFNATTAPTAKIGDQFVLVTADSGITGEFASALTNLTDLKVVITYTNDEAIGTLFLNLIGIPGLTANQLSVADYIDKYQGVVTTGDFATGVVGNLNNLASSPSALAHALDELSPQRLEIMSNVAFNNFALVPQRLDDHLAHERDGDYGLDTSGLAVTDPTDANLSQMKSRLLAWNPAPEPGLLSDSSSSVLGVVKASQPNQNTAVPVPDKKWGAFLSGNVTLADVSHNADVSHSNYTTAGALGGVDFHVTTNLRVGALISYEHTDADMDEEGSKAHIDSYQPGLYAAYDDKYGFYANGLLSGGVNEYSESRTIQFSDLNRTATGSPSGDQIGFDLDGGYDFRRLEGWAFGPEVGLSYVHLDINSFSESGAGAAGLNVSSQSADSLRSRIGGNIRYVSKLGPYVLTPRFSIFWQHEFIDDSRTITGQLQAPGLGTFGVQTAAPSSNSALIDLGINADLSNLWTVFLDYQAELATSDFESQSVQGGAKLAF